RTLCLAAVLCAEARVEEGVVLGDPTEGALVVFAGKAGVTRDAAEAVLPRVADIPFESATQLMATFHREGDGIRIFAKGAPEALLPRCATRSAGDAGEIVPMDEADRAAVLAGSEAMAGGALRVLAFATKALPATEVDLAAPLGGELEGLCFIGLAGLR